jgi:hypothetical protein
MADSELMGRSAMRERRIALAMAGRSQVSFEVMGQWIAALRHQYWPGPTFTVPEIYLAGHWTGVTPLRNLATYHALRDTSWDNLLWIDADHRIHHHLFTRCQQVAHLPLVCGPYFGRNYPFEIQAFSERQPGGVMYVPPTVLVPVFEALMRGQDVRPLLGALGVQWHSVDAGGAPLIPVAGGGTGCMLIRRDVLERMAERRGAGNVWRVERVPWEEQVKLLEEGESISGVLTEDILFCQDVAEELGEQTWLDLDPRLETGHMGEEPRDRRHYIASHRAQVPAAVLPGLAADLERRGYELVSEEGRPVNTARERERNRRRLDA